MTPRGAAYWSGVPLLKRGLESVSPEGPKGSSMVPGPGAGYSMLASL